MSEDAELSADLPRETALGIVITREETTADFGEGEVPTTNISAQFRGSGPGLFLDLTEPGDPTFVFPDLQLDSVGWVINAGIFVGVVEVTPAVSEIRAFGSNESTDATIADDDNYAFVAVRADGLEDVTIEAFDESGQLIGSCVEGDGFFRCE